MALNLKSLLKTEPIGRVNTTLGEFCLFHVTGLATSEAPKAIGKPLAECDPSDFVRQVARFVLYPLSSLRDGKYRPEEPVLDTTDLSSLTPADLESIASAIVDNEDYLSIKLIHKSTKSEDGKTVVSSEYGEVEHPRQEGESRVQYLHRLFIEKGKADARKYKDPLASISGIGRFSDSLNTSIAKSLSMGNSLSRHLESIRPTLGTPAGVLTPRVDMAALHRQAQEAHLRPFQDLADRIDQLTDITVQSSKFLVESNEIQTRIASELKDSGDVAAKVARLNFILTWIVIGLTILGLLLPTYLAYRTDKADANEQLRVERYVETISGTLAQINGGLSVQNNSLRSENEQLRATTRALEQRVTEMERRLSSPAKAARGATGAKTKHDSP